LSLPQKTASPEQIYFVGKSGIKVYPIYVNDGWYIQVDNNGVLKTFPKKVLQKEINDSVAKTIIYYYNLLKTKK
jgi:hypothetical protein